MALTDTGTIVFYEVDKNPNPHGYGHDETVATYATEEAARAPYGNNIGDGGYSVRIYRVTLGAADETGKMARNRERVA